MLKTFLNSRKLVLLAGLSLVLLLVFACGGSDDPAASAPTQAPEKAQSKPKSPPNEHPTATATAKAGVPTAAPAPTKPPSAKPASTTKRLRYAIGAVANETNRTWAGSRQAYVQFEPMLETLLAKHVENGLIVPRLAVSWDTDATMQNWTFKLRKGVEFHDGWGEFTAKDVMHTLKILCREDSRLSTCGSVTTRAERGDGSKDRHSVIFAAGGGKLFASPISSVPPEPHEEKYAIKLSGMMKKQLGLHDDRNSWVKTNYVNLVETPSPAIRKWAKRGDNDLKFCLGNAPQGLLKAIQEKREAAIADGAVKIEHVQRHDAQRDLQAAKQHGSSPRDTAPIEADGDKNRRYLPNDPARHADRLKRIQGAAHDKHERKTALRDARTRPGRPGLEI